MRAGGEVSENFLLAKVKSPCNTFSYYIILFQFCFVFGFLGINFAKFGRAYYNSINFNGNKLVQDIFDIALHGLPGNVTIIIRISLTMYMYCEQNLNTIGWI